MTWLLVTRHPQWLSSSACEPRFPRIHIAQFPYQVIGNCGVIYLLQRSNRGNSIGLRGLRRPRSRGPGRMFHGLRCGCTETLSKTAATRANPGSGPYVAAIVGWRCAQYDVIVAHGSQLFRPAARD